MKKLFNLLSIFVTLVFLSGCMALQADPTLLNKTPSNTVPLIKQDFVVEVDMNSRIARQATAIGIEELVEQSLKIALNNAKIFTQNGKGFYKIHAQITQASQSTMSFGAFPGKMEIEYIVKNQNGETIFSKNVYNEGRSDQWYFAGQMRHTRSRIVTAAENANQFVEAFNSFLHSKNKR